MRVVRILEGGKVVVDCNKRRRLIIQPSGRISAEFVPAEDADEAAQAFNDCFPDRSQWCEVVAYTALNSCA